MKKFLPLLLIFSMCSCSNINYDEINKVSETTFQDTQNTNVIINQEKENALSSYKKVIDAVFDNTNDIDIDENNENTSFNEDIKQLASELKDGLKNLEKLPFTLKEDNEIVTDFYKVPNFDFIVSYTNYTDFPDSYNFQIYNELTAIPNKYESTIKKYNELDWNFCDYLIGKNLDKLTFSNDEFMLIKSQLWYASQKFNIQNIPLSINVLYKDNKATKIYISYMDLHKTNVNKLSNKNKIMLEGILNDINFSKTNELVLLLNETIQTGEFNKNHNLGYKTEFYTYNMYDVLDINNIVITF